MGRAVAGVLTILAGVNGAAFELFDNGGNVLDTGFGTFASTFVAVDDVDEEDDREDGDDDTCAEFFGRVLQDDTQTLAFFFDRSCLSLSRISL